MNPRTSNPNPIKANGVGSGISAGGLKGSAITKVSTENKIVMIIATLKIKYFMFYSIIKIELSTIKFEF